VIELTAQHKRDIKRIIRKVQVFFENKRYYPRGNVFLDKVVLAHVSKSLNVAQSVMCLVDAGFPDEAFGLSRTMVEIALNLRFITNRYSERRAKRFVHYLSRWTMELVRRSLKHFYVLDAEGKPVLDRKGNKIPQHTKAQLRQLVRGYKRHIEIARKYPNRTSWTETRNRKASRGGAWMMAMEPDKYEFINGVPLKWEFDYDWMYFWTSQYVHATAVSMDAHATSPRHPFSVREASKGGEANADMAVFNSAVQLNKILLMAFRAIGEPFDSSIADPLGDFVIRMVREDSGKSMGHKAIK
jgi:hypothetical protein